MSSHVPPNLFAHESTPAEEYFATKMSFAPWLVSVTPPKSTTPWKPPSDVCCIVHGYRHSRGIRGASRRIVGFGIKSVAAVGHHGRVARIREGGDGVRAQRRCLAVTIKLHPRRAGIGRGGQGNCIA